MIRCAAFDIGGTLMEYVDMPYVWYEYYDSAMREAVKTLRVPVSEPKIKESAEIMKSLNPGVNYREKDYTPEEIFSKVTAGWNADISLDKIISAFFGAFHLRSKIYEDSIPTLKFLKDSGYVIATYTNVVSGMPDEMHKSYFPELLPYFDIYVSSISCGFRKPNPRGLEIISEKTGFKPDEIIFIGDEKKDPETARRFGCRSVLICRDGNIRSFGQDFAVTSLDGLPKILESLNKQV